MCRKTMKIKHTIIKNRFEDSNPRQQYQIKNVLNIEA